MTKIIDPAMGIALLLASENTSVDSLPESLQDPSTRALFLNSIDDLAAQVVGYHALTDEDKKSYLRQLAELSHVYITDVRDHSRLVNITLRLWAGCLDSAKTIASDIRSDPYAPEERTDLFENFFDPLARKDPIYRAGMQTAPLFKNHRKEHFSLEGVPQDSPVRTFAAGV
jgi:hypothetical protein